VGLGASDSRGQIAADSCRVEGGPRGAVAYRIMVQPPLHRGAWRWSGGWCLPALPTSPMCQEFQARRRPDREAGRMNRGRVRVAWLGEAYCECPPANAKPPLAAASRGLQVNGAKPSGLARTGIPQTPSQIEDPAHSRCKLFRIGFGQKVRPQVALGRPRRNPGVSNIIQPAPRTSA
jgi:hypothetical protein